MKFLLDESVDVRLAAHLRSLGHDATAVAVDYPASIADRQVLDLAERERRVLVTNDTDFGELVVAQGRGHSGVILLRLGPDADLPTKTARLDAVLADHGHELDRFIVVTRRRIRVRR